MAQDPQFPAYPSYGYVQPMSPSASIAAPVPRPPAVTAAFWLTMGGAGLWLAATVLGLVTGWDWMLSDIRSDLVAERRDVTDEDVELTARIAAGILIGMVLVSMIPYVTFAALARGGRNWARVTLTVFLSIGMLVSLGGLAVPEDAIASGVLVLLTIPLSITVIVLLFHRSADRFFTGHQV